MLTKKMLILIPQLFWTGASMAYWVGLLTPIMTFQQKQTDAYKNSDGAEYLSHALYALILLGVGQAISGIVMGRLVDTFGSKSTVFVNLVVLVLTIMISLWNIEQGEFNWRSYLTCFAWGFFDGIVNTHCL